jgi:hypothetical protein
MAATLRAAASNGLRAASERFVVEAEAETRRNR